MNLVEWAVLHVKHKDVFEKKLRDIKETGNTIVFTFDDRILTVYVLESLSLPDVSGETVIITLQTKQNITLLIQLWEEFVKHPTLTVTFANPGRSEQWSIKPCVHNRIVGENLKQSVRSMASGVTYV